MNTMTKYFKLTDNDPESRLKDGVIMKITGLKTTHNQFIEGVISETLNEIIEDESGTLCNGSYEEVKRPNKFTPMITVDVSCYDQPDDDDEDYYFN